MIELPPPAFESLEEYGERLGDVDFWEPYVRLAVAQTGFPQPRQVVAALPIGSYPTFIVDSGFVVKLLADFPQGAEAAEAELQAYRLLDGRNLPVPNLIATGQLFAGASWAWPYLILGLVVGESWRSMAPVLDIETQGHMAIEMGQFLRPLHRVPLKEEQGPLAPDWGRFLSMLRYRRGVAPGEHWTSLALPESLAREMDSWLPDLELLVDTHLPPRLVHADLHADHLFFDPETGHLTAVIDFGDAYAADPRYDLVALHMDTFRTNKVLMRACLEAYGLDWTGATWPKEMLALTLLHQFNMFQKQRQWDKYRSLDELAEGLWDLESPDLELLAASF